MGREVRGDEMLRKLAHRLIMVLAHGLHGLAAIGTSIAALATLSVLAVAPFNPALQEIGLAALIEGTALMVALTLFLLALTLGLRVFARHLAAQIRRLRSAERATKAQDFFKQLKQGDAPEFCMYLRPFAIERASNTRFLRRLRGGINDPGFETALDRAARPGLVVKIGATVGEHEELGSIKVDEKTWFDEFASMARAAKTLFLVPIAQKGTLKEIDFILSERLMNKTVLIMPKQNYVKREAFSAFPDARNIAEAWNASRTLLKARGSLDLPPHARGGGFLVPQRAGWRLVDHVGLWPSSSEPVLRALAHDRLGDVLLGTTRNYLLVVALVCAMTFALLADFATNEPGGAPPLRATFFPPLTLALLAVLILRMKPLLRHFNRALASALFLCAMVAAACNLVLHMDAGWGPASLYQCLLYCAITLLIAQAPAALTLIWCRRAAELWTGTRLQKRIGIDVHADAHRSGNADAPRPGGHIG